MKRFLFLALMPVLSLADITVSPPPVTPPPLILQPSAVTVPAQTIAVQPVSGQPAAVTPPSITITTAQEVANLQSLGYAVTLVPSLVASSNPFTIKVDMPNYAAPTGKTIKSVSAVGLAPNQFASGSSTHFPFMVTSTNNGNWAGGLITLAVTATFTDNSQAALGNVSARLNAVNASIIPTDGNFYLNGMPYYRGDFDFGGMVVDPYYWDASINSYVVQCLSTTTGGGWQPYFPTTTTNGVDTSKFNYLVIVIKPDQANKQWLVSFMADNDVPDGTSATKPGVFFGHGGNAAYGPTAPVVGAYNTYKIPLSDFGLTNPLILKANLGDYAAVPAGDQFLVQYMALTVK